MLFPLIFSISSVNLFLSLSTDLRSLPPIERFTAITFPPAYPPQRSTRLLKPFSLIHLTQPIRPAMKLSFHSGSFSDVRFLSPFFPFFFCHEPPPNVMCKASLLPIYEFSFDVLSLRPYCDPSLSSTLRQTAEVHSSILWWALPNSRVRHVSYVGLHFFCRSALYFLQPYDFSPFRTLLVNWAFFFAVRLMRWPVLSSPNFRTSRCFFPSRFLVSRCPCSRGRKIVSDPQNRRCSWTHFFTHIVFGFFVVFGFFFFFFVPFFLFSFSQCAPWCRRSCSEGVLLILVLTRPL